MPRKVHVYQTIDGRFFTSVEEATYEEAKLSIIDTARSAVQVTTEYIPAFLDFLEEYPDLVIEYCSSYKALSERRDVPDELAEMQQGEILNDADTE